jgi:hypothetical protein
VNLLEENSVKESIVNLVVKICSDPDIAFQVKELTKNVLSYDDLKDR